MEKEEHALAAVDLGSNSFHLVIAALTQGEVRIRDAISEKVQLGAGIDSNKNITPDAQQRALECLERYGERLQGIPQSGVRIVGTNALRLARNSDEFLAKASKLLGYPIDIIRGREEARLIYLGVSHTLADDQDSRLVLDIGGGSTEFIIGQRFETVITESLHMGCISYKRRFFSDGLSDENFNRALTAARQELMAIKDDLQQQGWDNCVGASGTIRSIHNILKKMETFDDSVSLYGLYMLHEKVLSFSRLEDIQMEGLSEIRAPILPSGLAILIAIYEILEIKNIQYSTGALREGVLYDLLGRIQHEDVRDRTVRALMQRYHINIGDSKEIKVTSLSLLRLLGSTALHDNKNASFLAWASLVHQLGLSVSHSQFHRHGSYLIRHSDLPGFSKKEQAFLAAIIANHRRRFTPLKKKSPQNHLKHDFEVLTVCLRLAVLFHRGHNEIEISQVEFSKISSRYLLIIPDKLLHENPLLRADLEQEAKYLKDAGIKLKLKG